MKTGLNFFVAGAYIKGGSFANYYNFEKVISQKLKEIKYEKGPAIKKLEELKTNFLKTDKLIDQDKAKEILVGRDISKIIKVLYKLKLKDEGILISSSKDLFIPEDKYLRISMEYPKKLPILIHNLLKIL